MRPAAFLSIVLILAPLVHASDDGSEVRVRALAVAQLPDGQLVGSTSEMTVRVIANGAGNVFVSTIPLAQIDMQGSARLAVKVAGATTGITTGDRDFLFLIRSGSALIGGPSAGGILTVATIAALEGWSIREDTLMTGTINPDGTIGPVGGVPEKAAAAAQAGARVFLYPTGQEAQDGDISAYCASSLHISCANVTTIEDAVAALTGHRFAPRDVPVDDGSSAIFTSIMRNATAGVLADASARLGDATRAFTHNGTNLTFSVARSLRASLQQANASLAAATADASAGQYASLARDASAANVESRYVLDTMDVAAQADPLAGLANAVDRVTRAVDDADNGTQRLSPVTTQNVGLLAAAQSRVADALRTRDEARSYAENASIATQFVAALHALAYAEEEARTGAWWMDLAALVPAAPAARVISPDELRGAAEDAVASAEDTLTYANLLVSESRADATQTRAATTLLAHAKDELAAGLDAAASDDATEAGVRASLAIELIGVQDTSVLSKRVELARDSAAAAIALARARGIEPVTARNAFELAGTSADPVEALALYQQARTVAVVDPGASPASSTARAAFVEGGAEPQIDAALVLAGIIAVLALVGGIALALRKPREPMRRIEVIDVPSTQRPTVVEPPPSVDAIERRE